MSFNPTRLTPHANRAYAPPPNSGRTRTQIMTKNPIGRVSVGPRTPTPYGFLELAFASDAFTVRREVMHARTSVGYGLNDHGDRVIVVDRGILFGFSADDSGAVQTQRLTPGSVLVAPRGKRHGYATSGTDGVELTVIETPNYEETWQQLQSPTETALAAPATSVPTSAQAPQGRTKAYEEVGKQHAQEVTETRARRRAKNVEEGGRGPLVTNANSSAVEGVNPRPSGPPRE